jgi:hypothetical protein
LKKGEIMKVLLAVTIAIFFGNSAFAADECSAATPTACKDAESCKNLPKSGSKAWTWNPESPVKCISGDGAVSSTCGAITDTKLQDTNPTGGANSPQPTTGVRSK